MTFRFKPLLDGLYAQARQWTPAQFLEPQHAESAQVDGLRSKARVRQHTIVIDEPTEFDGTDLAPNPAELLLAALGASVEVTCRVFADYYQIPVRAVSTSVHGMLDVHGFLDLDENTRAGFQSVSIALRIESDAPDDQIAMLVRRVQRSCPVLDVVRGATPIELTVTRLP